MKGEQRVAAILRDDPLRWHLLGVVAALNLPDCWIAAGFVRNAVWDRLHDREPAPIAGDVDVIWFDAGDPDPASDRAIEAQLRIAEPSIEWSVKNQARMHIRNGDAAYRSATDAMRYWPETATAVAACRYADNECSIAAPLGLDDLLNLLLRPTFWFAMERRAIFDKRVAEKRWREEWPALQLTKP